MNNMGNGMMPEGMWHMGASTWLATIIWLIILIGVAVLVWLWIIKLYKELFAKKK